MGGAALVALENYRKNTSMLEESLQRISTGYRINKASDDPSGLAIADKLRSQASSVKQSIENANSAVALIQIGDKAMAEQSNIIDTVKSKLIQASNATTSAEGREAIRKDIVKLLEQFDNIAQQTNYNGVTLLQNSSDDNSASDELSFQIGEKSSNVIKLASIHSNTDGVNLTALKNIAQGSLTSDNARGFLDDMDNALNRLNANRAEFGSTQNQLQSSVRYMMTMHTNLKASESVIRDVDYAQEVTRLSKLNLMVQASLYAISQINKRREQMLKYLFN